MMQGGDIQRAKFKIHPLFSSFP